jgi:hypothetical protein
MIEGRKHANRIHATLFWPCGLAGAVALLLCTGFVHRGIKHRRSRSQRLKRKLKFEEAQRKARTKYGKFQSARHRRRARGKGLAGSRWDALGVSRVSFGAKDVEGGANLRPAQIRVVMKRYNEKIGRCLLKFRAGRVTIRLTILGTGRLSNVETDLAGKADRCVRAAVQSARFPSFRGTKTTGQYHLRVK